MPDTPTTPRAAAKCWTDTDKLGILFQIISKMDKPIPWAEIELPEGRTLKAVQVMVDKEKSKVKQAKIAVANDGSVEAPTTPVTPGSNRKRGTQATDVAVTGEEPKLKKAKTPRKKKVEGGDNEETPETSKACAASEKLTETTQNLKKECDDIDTLATYEA